MQKPVPPVRTGCGGGSRAGIVTSAVPVAGSTSAASSTGSVRIALRFDDNVVPATLVDGARR